MLDADGLTFRYPRVPTDALAGVDLHASAGELLFLLGPNGSGKSTLFRVLLRLLRARTGTVTMDGAPLADLSPREVARRIAYIPQQESAAFNYTAWQTVLMGRTPHLDRVTQAPTPDDVAAARAAIATLRIEHLADVGLRSMSGGERQLVLIARAICQQASILVLDEPTSALDLGNQTLVLDELRRLADAGLLVVVSTHNPVQALQYGDRVVLLDAGRVVADGPPEAITSEALSDLYGTPVRVLTLDDPPGMRLCVPLPATDPERGTP